MSSPAARRSRAGISRASCCEGSSDEPPRARAQEPALRGLRSLRGAHAPRLVQLLLGLPPPPPRPAAGAVRRLRLLPRGRRHRRRARRCAGPRAPARALARRAGGGLRRPAAASDRGRARRHGRAIRHPARGLRGRDRRRRDGPPAQPLRDLGGRARGVLLPGGGRGGPRLHPGLRLPQPVGPAVRGRARPRLPADQHPARRGRGRAARPHLPSASGPPPVRLPRGGRAGRPLHRGVPAGDGVRGRARGRALRPGALPPRRGGPPVARARRGDAAHLRAAPPPHHVPALRRLRAEDPAHAAGEGGPRGRGLGAAASQLLLLARGMTARHVVVVGGGFAGLAAAVRLARAGTHTTLLERRPFLGGRAYSFAHPVTGEVVDNGPHALMGAYTEALDFLGEIGASAKLRVQPRLRVALAHPELGLGEVAAPAVPGPLQAPLALLRYRLLTPGDRARLFAAALLRLLPPALRDGPPFRALAAVGTSPIVSVHLWLDRSVGWGSSFLGLLGGRAQWLFDCGPARDGGQRVATVTSGARFWDDASDEAIAAEVLAGARAVLPALRGARCRRSLGGRERHATLSLTPAADPRRPAVTTPPANLFL